MYLPLIAAFIAISGSMGVSYMASDSLPGDALYPVKVHVTEEIRQLTAIGPAANAQVSADIISNRAEEARRLAVEGRLDSDAKARLSQEIGSELRKWNNITADWLRNGTTSTQTEARNMFESHIRSNEDIFQLLGVSLQTSGNTQATISPASTSSSTTSEIYFMKEDAASTTTGDDSSSTEDSRTSAGLRVNAEGVINVR